MKKRGIKQVKYCYIRKYKEKYAYIDENLNEAQMELEEIIDKIEQELEYPMFVKPSCAGSSIGINKTKNKEELEKAIKYAGEFDNKIIIEQGINAREIECAVLGNEEVISSGTGEIIPADEFYNYDAKYNNVKSRTLIPSKIEQEEKIRELAVKAFKAIDGSGLARVDFFVTEQGEIYINEINTMPGFTNISMYAKLWKQAGIEYAELIDKLIELALKK